MLVIHIHKLSNHKGFTLVEVMIAVAIIALLATFGYPWYDEQARKGKRSEAIAALGIARGDMERCYYNEGNDTYLRAGGPCQPSINISTNGYYTINAVNVTPQTYNLTAVPIGQQANDPCGTFGLDQLGTKTVTGLTVELCWTN